MARDFTFLTFWHRIPHAYPKAGRYVVAMKVVDIFGNDTEDSGPQYSGMNRTI